MLKRAYTGALVGAVTGSIVGIGYHIQSGQKNNKNVEKKNSYQYIEQNSEILFHAGEIQMFEKYAPDAVKTFSDSLDRLLAIESLSNVIKKEEVNPSWPITAQFLATEVSDALIVIEHKVEDQTQKLALQVHVEEIKTHLQNTLYNIDMNVQQKINE